MLPGLRLTLLSLTASKIFSHYAQQLSCCLLLLHSMQRVFGMPILLTKS